MSGPPVPLEIDLQSNPGRHGPDGGGRLINAFPQDAGEKAKGRFPIYCIDGLASFATLSGGGRTRGAINLGNYGYIVSGTIVWRVDSDGNAVNVGSFGGAAPVFMASNRKSPNRQIMLVSGGQRYILENDVLTSIADTDLGTANSVDFQGGYFVATMESGKFSISGIDEGTAWDALDFATAESKADTLYVVKARGREIILFGTESIEPWALTGAASFPFEANPGAFINNLGLLCRHSVKDLNDVVLFVASDGTVRRLNGYSPERISHHAVERDIAAVADKDSITATAFPGEGHQLYKLSCDNWTWVYDGLTQIWREEQSYGEIRWRGEGFVNIAGKRIVGDFENGLAYRLDKDTHTEAGAHLVWMIRTPPMHAYPNRVIVNRLFLDLIPGVGLNSANEHDADPHVMLRYSDDGGKSWSNQRTASVGRIGEFKKQIVFSRLGTTKEDGRIWEISMSAAVVRGLTSAAVDVEALEP